jgi:glyoxylase-like metal-dependent hydrolase (beta-lactamase superfamily II)
VTARIDRVVTSGTFSLDGGTWDVDNNVWLVGDDAEVVVVDPAHDAGQILDAIGDRRVVAIVATHGHNDHITAVQELRDATGARAWLHPDDRMLWDATVPTPPDGDLSDGQVIDVAGVQLEVRHTPGHSPGAVSLYVPALGTVLTGDTLFHGGPGATGRSYSHFGTIVASIRDRLLTLPPETRVLTGHGDETTIGDESPHLDEWIARGH